MDFGHLGFDNFSSVLENGGEVSKEQKCSGFGFLKQERAINEEDVRNFKISKTTSSSSSAMLRFPVPRCNGNGSEGHQQMLSFSSPVNLPYYPPHTSNPFPFATRNTGYGGGQQGVKGLFTASQWMELEHQALIYKYITANVPIPCYLLNPIRKAFESAGFPPLRSSSLGWGGFQLGFANSDPEPGRCRRTDGKKWRCSRDAVAEQKYCDRHMNRGRHRSRKPVEPQLPPPPLPKNLSPIPTINSRSVVEKEGTNGAYQQTTLVSMNTPPKQQTAAPQESSSFGLVCSDSLLNPLNRSSSLVNLHNKSQHPLRQFMDEWPKTHLSISIPISSPTNDNLTASPRELEMGLGLGPRQTNWAPISMGGPLGEVLQDCNNTKPLNLIDSWDNSPRLTTSPTGVLQTGAFGSVSSTASSPRAETGGSGLMKPSLPSL